jgi:4'-phosphopantetheinyl transferase
LTPFNQDSIQLKNGIIHLLRFEPFNPMDFIDHLTPEETERFFSFNHLNRQQEFVATRVLRHQLFGFSHIHYNEHGAPYIEDEGFISISHAPGIVGLAICRDFQIGLDIEPLRPKALLLKDKFLSEEEKQLFNTESELEMTKVWSAKEALYKLAGRKQLIFKTDLLLSKLSADLWEGRIINPNAHLKVELNIFVKDEYVITVNDNSIVIQ